MSIKASVEKELKNLLKKYNWSSIEDINWIRVSWNNNISESFIETYKDFLCWGAISSGQKLSEAFITKHKNLVCWEAISACQKLSEAFITKHKNLVCWKYISACQKLSESFITKHKNLVCWEAISARQKLSESFITKHKNLVCWRAISKCQKLSEPFITKHKFELDWREIVTYQVLSVPLIEKHDNFIDMHIASRCQRLPEHLIERKKHRVSWLAISQFQKLSESFIDRLEDYVDWKYIFIYQKLSGKFIWKNRKRPPLSKDTLKSQILSPYYLKKFKDYIDIDEYKKVHGPKSDPIKLKEIKEYAKKHRLLFRSEYLYAYRDHDPYGRGIHNRTLIYKESAYYRDWHCDLNPNNINSFGLGIWPKGSTRIKVHYKDWGVSVVGDPDGKARVYGFKVLKTDLKRRSFRG